MESLLTFKYQLILFNVIVAKKIKYWSFSKRRWVTIKNVCNFKSYSPNKTSMWQLCKKLSVKVNTLQDSGVTSEVKWCVKRSHAGDVWSDLVLFTWLTAVYFHPLCLELGLHSLWTLEVFAWSIWGFFYEDLV